MLSTAELGCWLALNRIPGIGPKTFSTLRNRFPHLSNLFKESSAALQALSLSSEIIASIKNPEWDAVEKELKWQEEATQTILTIEDEDYPVWLRNIASAPPVLYIKGNHLLLQKAQLAIVGSRNPTPGGRSIAYAFAKALVEQGLTVTSGLALGIDTAAHEGALAGKGNTIAVFGTGLSSIYPRQNKKLADTICEQQGALVSELPLDEKPKAVNFPRRNRIISGLSQGVLVVEAALKSGSLITAHYAVEQGRDVFAIPGSVHNPLVKGCHQLIRQGAKLIETVDDILDELPMRQYAPVKTEKNAPLAEIEVSDTLNKDCVRLLKCLGFEPTPVDVVVARTELSAGEVASMLSLLELEGRIAATGGGYIKLD